MYFNQEKQSPRYTLPPLNGNLHTPTQLPLFQQQQPQTFSYSPYANEQQQEHYYPIYNKEDFDNLKLKKKKDLDDRMKRINTEFLDNKQVIYEEKMKQLQQELSAVENCQGTYSECLADLEEKRKKTIDDARLMMIYQISCVDQEFQLESKSVQEESLAEKRDLQNTMYMLLEEKRKKLKMDKDGEGEHETRNRKRLSRKRADLEQPKKKPDRMREIPSYLLNALNHRVKQDIESDHDKMKKRLF